MFSERTDAEIDEAFQAIRSGFASGKSRPLDYRKAQLNLFKQLLLSHRSDIVKALYEDLRISEYVVEGSVFFALIPEIDYAVKNLDSWVHPVKKDTPFLLFPSSISEVVEPLGTTLIIGAWNYPFATTLVPFINAIAAGNSVILKPSESASASSAVMKKIVDKMDQSLYRVIEGGPETSKRLNKKPFDLIVFTGGTKIGKFVALDAAHNLSKVVLELGGKNPCIVDESCNIDLAVKRILNGKYYNCGQTCVTADYIFVHKNIAEDFKNRFVQSVKDHFGIDASKSNSYSRIINENHTNRLLSYLKGEEKQIIYQAGTPNPKEKFFPPTILWNPSPNSVLHTEEIFGPILYIMDYTDPKQVVDYILARDKPLVTIYFGNTSTEIYNLLKKQVSSGSLIANDLMIHYICTSTGFGGVGYSGCGKIRGEAGFREASYVKSVFERNRNGIIDIPFRYYPDNEYNTRWMRRLREYTGNVMVEKHLRQGAVVLAVAALLFFLAWLIKKKILVINI